MKILSLLLLIVPIIFQMVVGRKALHKKIRTPLYAICVTSVIAQVIFTFASFWMFMIAIKNDGIQCVTGAVGVFGISILIGIPLIVIIVFQMIKNRNNKATTL